MKTKFLFSFLTLILLSVSTYAYNNTEKIIYSNIETTENGCVKEFLFCDKETSAPISKTVYNYDAEGRMQEKTIYGWDSTQGWVGTQKFEYKYENSQPVLSVKKWDKKNNKWTK